MLTRLKFSRTRIINLARRLMPAGTTLFLLAGQLALPAGAAELKNAFPPGINPISVSAFANAAIPSAMRSGKIPGAVFVVVRGDQVICEKAFGVADLKSRARVFPDLTLFRVASISKILTAASVLQLASAGRLDLQRNVNAYLSRIHIAQAFGEPVTTADLLTHSAGFDDCEFGYAARTAEDHLSLSKYLAQYEPVRVRPPGLFSVYDNYGYTLAGYLVQKVSGMPFAEFVQKQILDPLDMDHSSFRPDAVMRRQLATGYWLDGDAPYACRPNYINIVPAAGFCTTASDMADFLVALLANQRPDGERMFAPDVLRGLETRQFSAGPNMLGRCYGFERVCLADRTALRQIGQWPGFNSVLLLFPKWHCGVFLAYNLCDDEQLVRRVCRRFAEQFIPSDAEGDTATRVPTNVAIESLTPFIGSYLSERAPHDMPELEFAHEIDVAKSPAGELEIGGRLYRPIGPRSFVETAISGPGGTPGGRRVMFLGGDGALHLITQDGAYRRVDWMDSAHGRLFLLRAATLVLLSVFVLWPIMEFMRLTSNKPPQTIRPSRARVTFSLMARASAAAACALALWFEISFLIVQGQLRPFATFYGLPAPVQHMLWALPALTFFAAALAVFCIFAWWRSIWHPAHRIHYTLLVAALGIFLYAFCSMHLFAAGFDSM